MTLTEKIGQMIMVQETQLTLQEVTDNGIGSLLLTASRSVRPQSAQEAPTGWADYYDTFQQAALNSSSQIPMMIGVDAVHGQALAIGATIIPHNVGLGATGDADLMFRLGEMVGKEIAATGCDWTLAPAVSVVRDIRWGRTYEGWGEVPSLQKDLVGSFIAGVQSPYNGADSIVACAKHYIADGGAVWGTGPRGGIDQGNVTVDEATLRELHLPPYIEAIENDIGTIMISYGKWQGTELHHQQYLITDLLKGELGFNGFIVSDFNGFFDVPVTDKEAVESACLAGVDMFMVSTRWREVITYLQELVAEERIPISRIDDAVRRILRLKAAHGILAHPLTDRTPALVNAFGSEAHRAISREAVQKSLVLLQNEGDLLPLAKNQKVYVAGTRADDIGVQCGGWTVEWGGLQGTEANLVIEGTTLLDGIEELVTDAGGTVEYSNSGQVPQEADVIIAVVGEDPSAEWRGDTSFLKFSQPERSMLDRLSATGIPMVVVVIASRPYEMIDWIDDIHALVMAWLPGTEGIGIADGLFGDSPFTGQLSLSWFRRTTDLPDNLGEQDYDPLFPRGFGINTSDQFHVETNTLIDAATEDGLTLTLAAGAANGTVRWSLLEGTLPEGFSLAANGTLSGQSATPEVAYFRVGAQDESGRHIGQTLSLRVVEGDTYGKWASGISWPSSGDEAAEADPDLDRFSNAVEILLGQHPLVADAPLVIKVQNEQTQLNFSIRDDLVGLRPVVRGSFDLETWFTEGISLTQGQSANGFIEFTAQRPAPTTGALFLQLDAESDR